MDESKTPTGEGHESPHWTDSLDGRMRVHIAYARTYASDYAHGAPGHLDLMTIAALAKLLDDMEYSAQNPLAGSPLSLANETEFK